jgi:hypothetical protein
MMALWRWVSIFGTPFVSKRPREWPDGKLDDRQAKLKIQRLLDAGHCPPLPERQCKQMPTEATDFAAAEPRNISGVSSLSLPNPTHCTLSSGSFRCGCQECVSADQKIDRITTEYDFARTVRVRQQKAF